jgi:hypothetical protein
MKVRFQDLLRRVTGFSTPVIGISWNPPEDERKVIRSLVIFLEDKRTLYDSYSHWDEIHSLLHRNSWSIESIFQVRAQLTRTLQSLPESSKAILPLRAMRAACRKFLNKAVRDISLNPVEIVWLERSPEEYAPGLDLSSPVEEPYSSRVELLAALGELRGLFGVQLSYLCATYGIDVEGELAEIFPPEDN